MISPYGWFKYWFEAPWFSTATGIANKLSIYNMVCVHLGEPVLTSLTSPLKIVGLLNAVYEIVRDNLLRFHEWNFATLRINLLEADTVSVGYDYRYVMPPQCLRVLNTIPNDSPYAVEGPYILSDQSSLALRYITRVTDESFFDSGFTSAFAAMLAAKICYNLTGSHQREQDLLAYASQFIPTAQSVGGIENPAIDDDSWEMSML